MTPTEEYAQRLAAREESKRRQDRMHDRMGSVRVALAGVAIVTAWGTSQGLAPGWLVLPVVLFLGAVLYHQRVVAQRDLAGRAVDFYRSGLDRLRGDASARQPGRAQRADGAQFADAHHIYCADLDLFGQDGVYATLCSARTPMGETTLARWLLAPAAVPAIRERHACIDELRPRLDLREALQVEGVPARLAPHLDSMTAWAHAPDSLSHPALLPAALLLAGAAACGAAAWAMWGVAFPLLAVVVIEAVLNYLLRARLQTAVAGVEHAYEDIKLLAQLLKRVEASTFETPRLRELQSRLHSHSQTASRTFARLATIVNFVEARRNPLLTPLLLPSMYVVLSALTAERWRRHNGPAVAAWLEVLGEIEALQSIAGFAFEHPEHCVPEFIDGPAAFVADGLGHPLIARERRICNDVNLSGVTRVLLVSGSNMSGKSTLLRAVGINTVLAMAGAPVCARRLRLTPLQVGASIRVNDSLHEGSSRFYAEITRLRQLFTTAPEALPLIFLLDELLQGTNSADRQLGARGVLRALLARGAIGLVSTHDLALADDADLSHGELKNVHFQDELHDAVLTFDFKLRDGVVTKSNGIELMRAIGLDV